MKLTHIFDAARRAGLAFAGMVFAASGLLLTGCVADTGEPIDELVQEDERVLVTGEALTIGAVPTEEREQRRRHCADDEPSPMEVEEPDPVPWQPGEPGEGDPEPGDDPAPGGPGGADDAPADGD